MNFKRISSAVLLSAILACGAFPAQAAPAKTKSADIAIDASKVVRTLQTELFGQNINVYDGSIDGKDLVFNAAVTSMGTSLLRFPGGGYCEFTDWENLPSGSQSWLPIDIHKGIAFAKTTNCQLQPCVNAEGVWADKKHSVDEAVKKAAKWVRYMNVKPKALYCKYWEVGNEDFKMKDYGERFVKFCQAMKKEDPTIKVGAQIQFDHLPWSVNVLKAIKAAGVMPDFFIVHAYPIWFPDGDRFKDKAPNWDKELYASNPYQDFRALDFACSYPPDYKEKLDGVVSENLGPEYVGKIPYWMTEFRSFMAYKYDEFVDTLFCAQFLLEMGRLGWQGSNIWALKNGFSTKDQCDYGLLRTGVNAAYPDDNPKSSPWPTYYIYPYLSRVFGRDLVECKYPAYAPVTQAGNKVRAWASKDADGNLTVLLVNNDPDAAATANVKVSGFAAGAQGRRWLFEPDGLTLEENLTPILQRRDIKINGVRRPEPTSLPGDGEPIAVGGAFQVKLPVASMMLVKIPAQGKTPAATGAKLVPGKVVTPDPNRPTRTPTPKPGEKPVSKVVMPTGPDTEVVLQEFTVEDLGGVDPWMDGNSELTAASKDFKASEGSDGHAVAIKYKQSEGGWCGFFLRAGSTWDGVDLLGTKAVVARVLAKQPVEFGVSFEDEDKNKLELAIPVKASGDWQTVKVPVPDGPATLRVVKGFNIFVKSPGTQGSFEVDSLKIVQPGGGAAEGAAIPAAEGLSGVTLILQDFAGQGLTASPWQDEKGSSMECEVLDAKKGKKDSEDGRVASIRFKQIQGGWCGFFMQAGATWDGVDCAGAKAMVARVKSKKPLSFGLSMEDEDKNKFEGSFSVKKLGEWDEILIPLRDLPGGFKLVKGFNLYMKSPGNKGSFEVDSIRILK